MHAKASSVETSAQAKCRICGCKLGLDDGDDFVAEVCDSCRRRPEGRRVLQFPKPAAGYKAARDFTPAEKSMIRRLHGYMPAKNLLDLLNERLMADLGPDAAPYTPDQLHEAIQDHSAAELPEGGHDRASLRRLLIRAQRTGLLSRIDSTVLSAFAIVFSLTPAQELRLKDVIGSVKEDQ